MKHPLYQLDTCIGLRASGVFIRFRNSHWSWHETFNLPKFSSNSVCCGFLGWIAYILTLVSAQCFQDQWMLWILGLDVLHFDLGISPMFPGPVNVVDSWAGCPTFWPWYLPNVSRTSICCGFLGWISYILTLVSAQCFQDQCLLWVPWLDFLHLDPGICQMISVCCGFLGMMAYILTLVYIQCFQDQCMLWILGHDGLHSDPGIYPMLRGPVYVVDSWAWWPTFWPWYLPNVSRTSVCCGYLGWMSYSLTLVSAQCFQHQCMLWIPGLDYLHYDPGF